MNQQYYLPSRDKITNAFNLFKLHGNDLSFPHDISIDIEWQFLDGNIGLFK